MRPLSICFAASEVAPYAKTGGLADVAAALPRELKLQGHQVHLFLPLYAQIDRKKYDLAPLASVRDVPVKLGWRTSTFSLWHGKLPNSELPVYFVDSPEMFQRHALYTQDEDEPRRFALLAHAVLTACQHLGIRPDVVHCNDWHTALIPLLMKTAYAWDGLFADTRTLLTLHNIGYQGVCAESWVEELGLGGVRHDLDVADLRDGRFNFLKTGVIHADALTTVSPTYSREIQTAQYGMGLESYLRARRSRLVGILNGVNYDEWSPDTDSYIPHRFSRKRPAGKLKNKRYLLEKMGLDTDTAPPLAGIVSRLAYQKGFELCIPVLPELLATSELRLVVLGSGEDSYEQFFQWLQRRFPGRVNYYRGYNNELSHLIEAAADLFLMPSRYEPCGLNQLFSLRYGTIPVVRQTGGLADSVQPFDPATGEGTGFVFEHFTPDGLRWALDSALAVYRSRNAWKRLMDNAMAQNYSWNLQAGRYVDLYRWLAGQASSSAG